MLYSVYVYNYMFFQINKIKESIKQTQKLKFGDYLLDTITIIYVHLILKF